jgi:hypothetical protein
MARKIQRVAPRKREPPILLTLIVVVGLKAFRAPDWLWGAVVTLLFVLWGYWAYLVTKIEQVETEPKWQEPTADKRP